MRVAAAETEVMSVRQSRADCSPTNGLTEFVTFLTVHQMRSCQSEKHHAGVKQRSLRYRRKEEEEPCLRVFQALNEPGEH